MTLQLRGFETEEKRKLFTKQGTEISVSSQDVSTDDDIIATKNDVLVGEAVPAIEDDTTLPQTSPTSAATPAKARTYSDEDVPPSNLVCNKGIKMGKKKYNK